jgi:hypothetical protein
MKKIIITSILWSFFIPTILPQGKEHVGGGHFVKKVEYNLIASHDIYNIDSKGEFEKLFFGDFNASVEFFYNPAFGEALGFRIVKHKFKTSYMLEFKYISNYKEVQEEIVRKYPSIDAYKKRNIEMLKLFKIETRSFSISNRFAEELYKKMASFIDNFKAKGIPPGIFDGYRVVFRSVVEDEVWSLNIHMPNGDALKMSDLCRQIITDARAHKLDESKYLTTLNTFEE